MWYFHDSTFCHLRLSYIQASIVTCLYGGFGFCLLFVFVWELVFFHCYCKTTRRILPRSQLRQGLRKDRHLIGLKKISPVLQVGTEQTLLQYFTGDFQSSSSSFYVYMFSVLRGWGFGSQRLLGWIFISLRNTQLLGLSEGRVGWDGLNQFRVCLWLRGVVSAYFY